MRGEACFCVGQSVSQTHNKDPNFPSEFHSSNYVLAPFNYIFFYYNKIKFEQSFEMINYYSLFLFQMILRTDVIHKNLESTSTNVGNPAKMIASGYMLHFNPAKC